MFLEGDLHTDRMTDMHRNFDLKQDGSHVDFGLVLCMVKYRNNFKYADG